MQKVANHPLLRVLKNVWIEAIIVVNISVSDCCLVMLHLLKPSSRCGEGLEKLQRLRILRQHDPSCGSMCRQSHVSGFKLQCCFCIPAKGHTGDFLHKSVCVGFVFFSPPDAYLVITAITMAALVCLFAEMVHQSVCIPLTGADVSAGRPGRDTADREDADCRCGDLQHIEATRMPHVIIVIVIIMLIVLLCVCLPRSITVRQRHWGIAAPGQVSYSISIHHYAPYSPKLSIRCIEQLKS